MACISFLYVIASITCAETNAAPAPQPVALRATPPRGAASPATVLLTRYRREKGLGPVVQDPLLQKVAQAQAVAMAKSDTLSHEIAGNLLTRLAAFGAPCNACAENVGAGYRSLTEAFDGWKNSSGHNANLLNPAVRRIGIASARAVNSKYGTYWALVLTQ